MEAQPEFRLGFDGFVWWVGVIESVDDPQKIGRCKCRIIGFHDADPKVVATSELPWAFPVMPVTGASTTPNYRPGDWVVGWFFDGKIAQSPVIFGVLPAVPQA